MVLGSIAIVRQLAGNVQTSEMDDDTVEEYLGSGTSFVVNKTGVTEAQWPTHEDYEMAKHGAECFAGAYIVLVVSTVKDPTARHEELLKAAQLAVDTIILGFSETGGQFFINVNSKYKTYENNPSQVLPYESFK